ncbi:MAG: bacterioferritin-associated ferredoxin [Alphaproteobacteria bacterium]
MIVCVCNVLSESDVRAAIAGGARDADAVYSHHGCERECGTCACMIEEFLSAPCRAKAAAEDPVAIPA